ncbi:MAG: histidinol-phosphatase [Peptococcaceae bacterium]|nr:histidinol-phosphatase [Peptococcaceae bacterium]
MKAAGLCDYHLHTSLCGHAEGGMEEYLAAAERAGLTEVGFADHLPQYFLPPGEREPGLGMSEDELPRYVEKVLRLAAKGGPVRVKLGIEADYVPGCEETLARLLESYPFDYVLGSVHYVDGWGFDNPDLMDGYAGRDIDGLYRQYFALVQAAARSGLFDIMAHPDLIKKFGFRPGRELTALYEETAQVFAGAGVCVEVNTAGLRVPAGEIYPAPDFLVACRRRGVPVTFGSDAHRPEQVGYRLREALLLAGGAGYERTARFTGRRMELVRL